MRSSRAKCRDRKAKAEVTLKNPHVQTCVANKELLSETEEKWLQSEWSPRWVWLPGRHGEEHIKHERRELCKELSEEHRRYRRAKEPPLGIQPPGGVGAEVRQKLDGSGLEKKRELRDEGNFF